ncbi:putative chromate transport protein [BD1-7 clade bacterium]|uniref:Putative chromate transport protein n=1 Tax=BD1-7 clade bacterium TaxID=2029982 RepID=A0A5S9QEP6_9GAMM|nr:putative chromate transport protein [BD1-7 clade bacterium]CAA0117010.1 putative chromate transport protein [BD1-7 clade bacterium]
MLKRSAEVFWQFFLLGLYSFGGPAAHIGYFQRNFVDKLDWLSEKDYTQLVALSQFLPGPGSSQVGFAIGLRRAGLLGGACAFIGFTLPSFLLLYAVAVSSTTYAGNPIVMAIIHGLKLFAVVVVADAVLTMFKAFCQESRTIAIAVAGAIVVLCMPYLHTQIALIGIAAIVGALWLKPTDTSTPPSSHKQDSQPIHWWALVLFVGIFAASPLLDDRHTLIGIFNDFYHAGSLVFGGGHVVLPLLQQTAAENLTNDQFLMAYSSAQAVPGPMFTMASFLGADLHPDGAFAGSLAATIGVFLPGLLLVIALQGAWQTLTDLPHLRGAVSAINAAVVGLLIAALYQPVFTSAVANGIDMALVIAGIFALRVLRWKVLLLVAAFMLIGPLLPA